MRIYYTNTHNYVHACVYTYIHSSMHTYCMYAHTCKYACMVGDEKLNFNTKLKMHVPLA